MIDGSALCAGWPLRRVTDPVGLTAADPFRSPKIGRILSRCAMLPQARAEYPVLVTGSPIRRTEPTLEEIGQEIGEGWISSGLAVTMTCGGSM
jgi:hypothetical protein